MNRSLLAEYIRGKTSVAIVCKGELDGPIPDTYDIYFSVKQSIIVAPKKDVLVTGHFEGVFGIEQHLPDIKYIVVREDFIKGSNAIGKQTRGLSNIAEFEQYVRSHGFKGELIHYDISQHKPGYDKNGAWLSLFILRDMGYRGTLDAYGYYNSNRDNQTITQHILNATIVPYYQDLYAAYLKGVYRDRNECLRKNWRDPMRNKGDIRKRIMSLRNETTTAFPTLNLIFVSSVRIYPSPIA